MEAGESVTFSVEARNYLGFTASLPSDVGLEMVWCPPGTFTMGSPDGELGRDAKETRHTVVLTQGFWIGRYEVTQPQYQAVMGMNPSSYNGDNWPVDSVSFRDALNLCERMTVNEKDAGRLPKGYLYTLPTEAQWEYACRAGTTTALNSGKDLSSAASCDEMGEVGWYRDNAGNATHAVGQKPPNAWGLHDMHGNVSEWCWDFYKADYPSGTVTNPTGPWSQVDGVKECVLRGGSWNTSAQSCRSAARDHEQVYHGGSQVGFRLALARNRNVFVPLSANAEMEMVWIGSGTFTMGSPTGELGRQDDETQHAVTLTRDFWLGKYEVTQKQYETVMGAMPDAFDGSRHGRDDNMPVYFVSRDEALAFCAALTDRERAAGRLPAGYRFALPTEAQWEYACRAGTTKALNNGHNLTSTTSCSSVDQVGWYKYNSDLQVHPTHGAREPNNVHYEPIINPKHCQCQYDMHGNVREWVADRYGAYPSGAATDPTGPETGDVFILRGGGFDDEAWMCRSAMRIRSDGSAEDASGFRVAIVSVEGAAANPDELYPVEEPELLTGGMSYQWYKDGTAIAGATGASLTIAAATAADAGRYTVDVWCQNVTNRAAAVLAVTLPPVPYLDPVNHTTNTCETYTPYTGQTTLAGGWWVVSGAVALVLNNLDHIDVSGDVNLILCDGASLTANVGITVDVDNNVTNSLTIWAQSDGADMGRLSVSNEVANRPAIGATQGHTAGVVTINGGEVSATCGNIGNGAAIGGSGIVATINGGRVTAVGAYRGGAGIGCHAKDRVSGSITINGGKVSATGMSGAGIGGGGGDTITSGSDFTVTVNGGEVTAIGGNAGAGIGGGWNESGCTVTIAGGTVTAIGSGGAAGIGGGVLGAGGTVAISGGTVTAIAGTGAEAIGHGENASDEGGLVFPSTYCAYSPETNSVPVDATKRMAACRGESVKLTLCDPHGYAYRNNGADHTVHCPYCDAEDVTEPHAFVNGVCACGEIVPPSVSNVVARQRWPWNGLVDVDYEISGYTAGLKAVIEVADAADGRSWTATNFLAGTEPTLTIGKHRVTWDTAAAGLADVVTSNAVAMVKLVKSVSPPEDTTSVSVAIDWDDNDNGGGSRPDSVTANLLANGRKVDAATIGANDGWQWTWNDLCKFDQVTGEEIVYTVAEAAVQNYLAEVSFGNGNAFTAINHYNPGKISVSVNVSWDDAGNLGGHRPENVTARLLAEGTEYRSATLNAGNGWSWTFADLSSQRDGTEIAYTVVPEDLDVAAAEYYAVAVSGDSTNGFFIVYAAIPATSSPFRLDTREGPFESDGTETLAYSVLWHGDTNATVTIAQDGVALGDATGLRGAGDYEWEVTFDGTYTLTHATSGANDVETAIFRVTGLTKDFADGDIRLTPYDAPYDGQPHTIGVATNGTIAGLVLRYATAEGGEYSGSAPALTSVGSLTVYVEASAPGYYTTTNSAAVTITPRDFAGATVAAIGDQTFAGSPLTPAVSVEIGGLRPAEGIDYDAAYANNAAPGTATVTLTGKGNYTGATAATFRIVAPPTPPSPPAPVPAPVAATYTVRFAANGGKLPKGAKMAPQRMTCGKAAKLRKNAFTRKGYVFAGWARKKGGPVAFMNRQKVKDLAAAGKTVTLYAVWRQPAYTVKFAANGGKLPKGAKMAPQRMARGKAARLRQNAFTRKGRVFAGWARKKGGPVAFGDRQKVRNLAAAGKTATLYAVWAKPTYRVAFRASGGSGTMHGATFAYGEEGELPACAFTRDGYRFAGWAKSDHQATRKKPAFRDRQTVKNLSRNGGTVVLYAVWVKK